MANLANNKGIPFATTRYREKGFTDRAGYLAGMAEEYGLDLETVWLTADLLGPEEDFDGLLAILYDESIK
jgi:hypothetical protein